MNVLHTLLNQTSSHGAHDMLTKNHPRYVLRKIFAYLDFTTLRHVCAVSRVCRDVGGDPYLWAAFNQWADMPADDAKLIRALTQVRKGEEEDRERKRGKKMG